MGKNDLGVKPKTPKVPNEIRKQAAAAREKGPIQPPALTESDDEFGDGSTITRDWRNDSDIVDYVLKQTLAICWAIALTRLLQAIYNITRERVADRKKFCHEDLVVNLKMKQNSDPRRSSSSMKLQNLKDAINYIAVHGVLKIKESGITKAGSEIGYHGKWNFSIEKSPSAAFIRSKVDISPVMISFDITSSSFYSLGNEIYEISTKELKDEEVGGHAVLVVAYGYTKEGRPFFVIQNSWGKGWGVKGFGRIFVDEDSKTTLVYPD